MTNDECAVVIGNIANRCRCERDDKFGLHRTSHMGRHALAVVPAIVGSVSVNEQPRNVVAALLVHYEDHKVPLTVE